MNTEPETSAALLEAVTQLRELQAEVLAARDELGGFCEPPFDGTLVTAIRAISMRCAAAERERNEAKRLLSEITTTCESCNGSGTQWEGDPDNPNMVQCPYCNAQGFIPVQTLQQDLAAAKKDAAILCEIIDRADPAAWRNGNTHPDNPNGLDEGEALMSQLYSPLRRKYSIDYSSS